MWKTLFHNYIGLNKNNPREIQYNTGRTMTRCNNAHNATQDNITKPAIQGQQTHIMHTMPQCHNATMPQCPNTMRTMPQCNNAHNATQDNITQTAIQSQHTPTIPRMLQGHHATMPPCPNTMRTTPRCPNTMQYIKNYTSLHVREVLDQPINKW